MIMLMERKRFIEEQEKQKEKEEFFYFEQGIFAFLFQRFAEAARYFLFLEEKENSAVFFNLALCFFQIQNYSASYSYLQKALSKVPRNRKENFCKSNIVELEKQEEENDSYQKPMLYSTPIEFPDLAREQILRFMVDVLFCLGQKDEMMQRIYSLKKKEYKNIREKIERS